MTIPNCLSNAPGILAAELTIDGLALCCFNQMDTNNKFWEVAYVRHKKHALTITVEKVSAAGASVIHGPFSPAVEAQSFDIRLDTGTNDLYQNFPHGGCRTGNFNRATPDSNNPNDLRWMIDFASTEPGHGNVTQLKPPGNGRVGVTLATLRHTLLFTRKPTDFAVKLVPRCSTDPTQGDILGRTNEKIGGLLMAPTAGQIVFTGLNIPPLPFDAQTSYRISLINEDRFNAEHWPGLSKGDFHFLYDVVEVDGQQKELWAVVDFLNAPDGDCNGTFINADTLQPLIQ